MLPLPEGHGRGGGEKHGLKKGKAQAPIALPSPDEPLVRRCSRRLEVLGQEEVLRRLTMAGSA